MSSTLVLIVAALDERDSITLPHHCGYDWQIERMRRTRPIGFNCDLTNLLEIHVQITNPSNRMNPFEFKETI